MIRSHPPPPHHHHQQVIIHGDHHCHRHPRPRRHYPYHGFHEEGF